MSLIGILLSGSWIIAAIMIGIATAITIWGLVVKEKRNKIITNLNLMVTMLLGGLWHGASLNFVIWGGLNGIGIVIYKIWRSLSMNKKFVVILLTAIILYLLTILSPLPIWNILFIWVCIITIGTFVRWIYSKTNFKNSFSNIGNIWGIFQTFVFISFTRLFFRSGSNLDPALANEQAWVTAQNMIHQIGSTWDFNIIPSIFQTYSKVFILFLVGMLIHWIPDKAKRWYRINFSLLPLPIMAIIVVLAIFIICQFLTSNLQAFIYFQF